MRLIKTSSILLISLALISCSKQPTEKHHQPSGVKQHTPGDFNTFSEYKKAINDNTRLARSNAGLKVSPEIVEGNGPFEFKAQNCQIPGKARAAVLMIHGYSGSPAKIRELGMQLSKQCLLVRAITLPYHSTINGDMTVVKKNDWIRAAKEGLQSVAKENSKVILMGYSFGGALALNQALKHTIGNKLKAVMLFAPAIDISNKAMVAKIVKYFKPWRSIKPQQDDHYGYSSSSHHAIGEIFSTIKQNRKLIKKKQLNMPLLMVVSDEDTSINPNEAISYFKSQEKNNRHNRLYIYTNNSSQAQNTNQITYLNSSFPEHRIDSFAHGASLNSSTNPIFGKGRALHCNHYHSDDNNPGKYVQCKSGENIVYGARTKENKQKYVLARTMYNPGFKQLVGYIENFINNTLIN